MVQSKHSDKLIEKISNVMIARGLEPAFLSPFIIDMPMGRWLAIPLDARRIGKMEHYVSGALEKQMAAVTRKSVMIITRKSEVFYLVLLSSSIILPEMVEREYQAPGKFQVGVNLRGNEVSAEWKDLGHVLVAGMTGHGKSVFLRNLVHQAIDDKFQLALVDADEMTFPYLANHPLLFADIGNIDSAEEISLQVLQEISRRKRLPLFTTFDNYWQSTEEQRMGLRPLLFAVDEANSLIAATGGINGQFSSNLKQIAWRGRKFGVILVVAGQTFEKAVVGQMRDQLLTRVCFRVADQNVSRIVLGSSGAEKIDSKGRAITNRWGVVQTYFTEKFHTTPVSGVDQKYLFLLDIMEREYDSKVTLANLKSMGYSQADSSRIRRDLVEMGLIEKNVMERNAFTLTESALEIIGQKRTENLETEKTYQTAPGE